MKWLCGKIFGKKYSIVKTNKLMSDEILVFGHRVFIGTKNKEVDKNEKSMG